MITKHEARGIIRQAIKRVPEGEEIRHLNIMPMMDIMTILLVAFLFSASQDAALSVGDAALPASRSFAPKSESAVTLTLSKTGILVQGKAIVDVKNGDVDASEKKDGALGIQIPRLSKFLGKVRRTYEAEQKSRGQKIEKIPELYIIADKATPYKLLFSVIVSSRSEDAGYRRFRLIVLDAKEEAYRDDG
jgi:biopolymer transport protein ExbD